MGSRAAVGFLVACCLVGASSASPSKSVNLGAGEFCDLYYSVSLKDGKCDGNEKIAVPCDGWCASYVQCNNGVPETKGKDCSWFKNFFDPSKKECTFDLWRNCNWYKSLTVPPPTFVTPGVDPDG
ncbi:Zinc metalloproteinase nas-19 [Frankliniella fusca]|uniref:Zinc metalloproteinase nas-19 n=1 Tax=Frankliniella fusca TaxID=407009 RepID=A0AAE1GUA4_9NEOP|nr:Zinc metalloproteinase nas-19 [Frankliniella fusca]